jgi:hypothetical protein
MCEVYGMAGSLFGCASIWSMTFIALDRYNVIVKVYDEGNFYLKLYTNQSISGNCRRSIDR